MAVGDEVTQHTDIPRPKQGMSVWLYPDEVTALINALAVLLEATEPDENPRTRALIAKLESYKRSKIK